jgi:two-component system, OmpR family, KDP operon response regulator KdpE
VRVLVVDDQDDIRTLLRVALGGEGIAVSEAASGDEALNTLDVSVPDLVVLDIQMPVIDGWEVLEKIRERPATKDLAVIVCTVKASQSDAERGWRLGCDGYVTKPFMMDRLIGEVRRVAGSAQVDREATRKQALADIERAVGTARESDGT